MLMESETLKKDIIFRSFLISTTFNGTIFGTWTLQTRFVRIKVEINMLTGCQISSSSLPPFPLFLLFYGTFWTEPTYMVQSPKKVLLNNYFFKFMYYVLANEHMYSNNNPLTLVSTRSFKHSLIVHAHWWRWDHCGCWCNRHIVHFIFQVVGLWRFCSLSRFSDRFSKNPPPPEKNPCPAKYRFERTLKIWKKAYSEISKNTTNPIITHAQTGHSWDSNSVPRVIVACFIDFWRYWAEMPLHENGIFVTRFFTWSTKSYSQFTFYSNGEYSSWE